MKKYAGFNYAIYGFMYAGMFFFMGVFNLAVASWDLAILNNPNYWMSTGSATLMYLMAFTNTVALAIDIKKSTDTSYLDVLKTIDTLSRKVVDHRFREFMDKYNWRTKRNQWKEEHENLMVLFNNKFPYDVHQQITNLEQKDWSAKTWRWYKKRVKLEKSINDDWIDKNVKFMKYHYPLITPQEVRTGEVKKFSKKRLLSNGVILKSLLKRSGVLLITVVANAFISAMTWTGNVFNFAILAQIAAQFIIVILNIGLGFREGAVQFQEVVMNNLLTREDILTEYVSEQQGKGVDLTVKSTILE